MCNTHSNIMNTMCMFFKDTGDVIYNNINIRDKMKERNEYSNIDSNININN